MVEIWAQVLMRAVSQMLPTQILASFILLRLMTHTVRRVFAAISRGLPCHT